MNCDGVRELLPEHALGVAGGRGRAVQEHLARCAACRKESRDLHRAAATLSFALAPASPPPGLEADVVARVRSAAGTAPVPRRPRRGLTLVLAATLALGGIGGGAVLAGRDSGEIQPEQIQGRQDGLDAFRRLVEASRLADDETEASLAVLMSPDGGPGSGSAMAIVAPSVRDRAIVVTSGLGSQRGVFPYSVWLADADGSFIKVGTARSLATDGGFTVGRILGEDQDLSGYVNVLVRNGRGKVVLSGTLTSEVSLPTPAP
ncbi:MAG: hypothetical protein WD096_00755 [Actinomycetota bacterium]